jgi:hypothetical protein
LKHPAHPSTALAAALLAALALFTPAFAQSSLLPKPWRPASADSITQWAIEGRNLLAESNSPELGDREVVAYRWVDKVAKAYFHSLGPHGMAAAGGLSAFLDSLKLKGSVVSTRCIPPSRSSCSRILRTRTMPRSARSTGSAATRCARSPSTSKAGTVRGACGGPDASAVKWASYTMQHDRDSAPEFIFMRMILSGAGWEPVQAGVDVDFGGKGTATFADLTAMARPRSSPGCARS